METADQPSEPDALLVMALWHEHEGGWRVRISCSTRVDRDAPDRSYAATRPDVLRTVEEWLDRAVTPP